METHNTYHHVPSPNLRSLYLPGRTEAERRHNAVEKKLVQDMSRNQHARMEWLFGWWHRDRGQEQ